ncbi:hypothetical protein WISP_98674 [Willisornis vidua]|uniref:Uncharacterized protein n=1 Tax=Willisornis vidua TaxID=1566151 RepID=A0ABQ9D211_9PASS|nr:hypothetical protein WISP_98674 [Willisornis vidua]
MDEFKICKGGKYVNVSITSTHKKDRFKYGIDIELQKCNCRLNLNMYHGQLLSEWAIKISLQPGIQQTRIQAQTHRIIEYLELEGTLRIFESNSWPCTGPIPKLNSVLIQIGCKHSMIYILFTFCPYVSPVDSLKTVENFSKSFCWNVSAAVGSTAHVPQCSGNTLRLAPGLLHIDMTLLLQGNPRDIDIFTS